MTPPPIAPPAMPPAPMGPAAGGTSSGAAGSGGSSMTPSTEVCDGPSGALSASDTAPTTMLFVLDRSTDMATEWDGAPRWQGSAHALQSAIAGRANTLTMGALLYPSASISGRTCTGPDWLCMLQGPTMCSVSPMASSDQVAFQPAPAALQALLNTTGVYAPVSAAGVPLGESLQRADTALAAAGMSNKTRVVILASSTPTCDWDAMRARTTVERWKAQGVKTFVVALPGANASVNAALTSLAEAGGTSTVHSPLTSGALEATLQSIAFDSMSSCSLELDPPAADPSVVRVLVTQGGMEHVLPQVGANGEPLWSITADGKTVTLLGTACATAQAGGYDALRVSLGCSRP